MIAWRSYKMMSPIQKFYMIPRPVHNIKSDPKINSTPELINKFRLHIRPKDPPSPLNQPSPYGHTLYHTDCCSWPPTRT